MNHVERISFAAVRKAWGENRGAEILSAPLMAGWKIAVRKSLDYLRAWPGAAGRQSRKRPFVWTSPRRSRSVQRRRAGKKSLSHWRPALDAVLPRSAHYVPGSTCHGTDLSPVRRRGSPARGSRQKGDEEQYGLNACQHGSRVSGSRELDAWRRVFIPGLKRFCSIWHTQFPGWLGGYEIARGRTPIWSFARPG